MIFQGFQNLYQHLKKDDIRLFECFDKVSEYIKQLASITSVSNKVVLASSTGNLVLPVGAGAAAIIPGAFVWLTLPGTYLISGIFSFQELGAGDIGSTFFGTLRIGNAPQVASAYYTAPALNYIETVGQQWVAKVSGNQQVSLFAYKGAGAGASIALQGQCTISAILIE
jgi:hypothetical protein